MERNILLRSMMFLPAYNRHFVDKALDSEADALILDVEDSVPIELKQSARDVIREYSCEGKFRKKNIFIRINEIGTKDFAEDVCQLILPGILGIMPSKIKSEKDIIFLDYLLDMFEIQKGYMKGSILLAPLIETTHALTRVDDIAQASKRMVALCFGGEDYLSDLGCIYTYQTSAFVYPRAKIVNAARMARIQPIDTPYLDISDLEGLELQASEAYKNGFAGNLVLNPKQIECINRTFMPEQSDVAYAQNILNTVKIAKEKGKNNLAMYQGRMIGPPMRKRAETVIKQMEMLSDK